VKNLLRSRTFQMIASIVLGVGLLAFFLSRVPLADIGRQIAAISTPWLLTAMALSLFVFVVRTTRWIWILRPVGEVPFFPAFRATAIGFAANTVLPARAGEVLRPALLARERSLPFSALLASILFERVLDALAQLSFFAFALAGPDASRMGSLGSTRVRVLAGAVAVGAIVVALFAVAWRTTTERLIGRMFRILPERLRPAAERIAHTFLDGFASLKTPRLALLVGAGSLAMWMVINIQIYCIMRAFGLELPISAAFVVTTAAVLGLFVPTPGGVGAIKSLTSETRRPVVSVEEVTVFEPPARLGYKLLSGLPLRNYEAEIALTEAPGGGTDITWRSQFDPKFPLTGGLFRRALQKFTDDAARRLAAEAERTAGL